MKWSAQAQRKQVPVVNQIRPFCHLIWLYLFQNTIPNLLAMTGLQLSKSRYSRCSCSFFPYGASESRDRIRNFLFEEKGKSIIIIIIISSSFFVAPNFISSNPIICHLVRPQKFFYPSLIVANATRHTWLDQTMLGGVFTIGWIAWSLYSPLQKSWLQCIFMLCWCFHALSLVYHEQPMSFLPSLRQRLSLPLSARRSVQQSATTRAQGPHEMRGIQGGPIIHSWA